MEMEVRPCTVNCCQQLHHDVPLGPRHDVSGTEETRLAHVKIAWPKPGIVNTIVRSTTNGTDNIPIEHAAQGFKAGSVHSLLVVPASAICSKSNF